MAEMHTLANTGAQAIKQCACLLVSYRPLAHAGFPNAGALEAAPRGRDLLKLAHCRTDSSPGARIQLPMEADRGPTPTSHWGLALWRRGVAERRMRSWPHRRKTNLGAPTASSSDLVLGFRSPLEDGQNGRYEILVSPPKALPTRSDSRGRRLEAADFSHNRRP